MLKKIFYPLIFLFATSPCLSQINYYYENGGWSSYSEFTYLPADSLTNKKLLLAESFKDEHVNLNEDSEDTLYYTRDTAVIMRLVRLNNKLSAWWNKNLQESGDYFVADMQSKIKVQKKHFYRLYFASENKNQFDVYYFSVNMNNELFKMASVPELSSPVFYSNSKTWSKGRFVQKHLLTEKQITTAVPTKGKKLFIENYYHRHRLYKSADIDPMDLSNSAEPITESDWIKFKSACKTSTVSQSLTDKDKSTYRIFSVHYLLP